MKDSPRNSRYYQRRRAAIARQRQQMLMLMLAVVALIIALAAALSRRTEPQVADVPTPLPGAPTEPPRATMAPWLAADDPPAPAIGAAEPPALPMPPTLTPGPADDLFNPQRFSYAPDFYTPQIQALLDAYPGPLKSVRFQVGDRSQSFAEVLVGMGSLYSINPQIFLALLEQQSQLLSTSQPTTEQLAWAMGFQGEGGQRRGLFSQLRWAGRELRWAVRDYAGRNVAPLPPLVFADGSRQAPFADMSMTRYALSRVLAPTTTPDRLPAKLDAFLVTYTRLFGDPRPAPADWPAPAAPFLTRPMETNFPVTSFFDHDAPFLQQNGSLLTFWGRTETNSLDIGYDGHTGWDYAMRPPDRVLAAADGIVVFAGNSDDGCATPARAVIIDHGNGYRTLYWHLHSIAVVTGQEVARGTLLGVAGETGCAFGPHLHLQVQFLGRDVDPYGWCGADPDPWNLSPAGQVSVWLWADRPNPCGPPPPGVIIVDDASPGFATIGAWLPSPLGYSGGALFAPTSQGATLGQPWRLRSLTTPAVAIWRPELPQAGRYRVMAYVPYVLNGLQDAGSMRYQIRYSGGEADVVVNAAAERNWWADLGIYEFDPADAPMVSVSSLAGAEGEGVWADAIAWIPVE